MTSIYIDDWPVGHDFRTEEDGRVLVTILQEFFPEREFPLLFRSFEYEYEVKISRQWGNVERDLSLMQRQKNLTKQIHEKYTDPAMKAKLTTRIDTINSILSKLTRPVKGIVQQRGTEINAFQEDNLYLEIGLNARESIRQQNPVPQLELLVIHNVIGEEGVYDSIDFSGVAFNPNRGYSPTYANRLYSFTEYYRNNVEDNSTVLQTVYELTYEIYAKLIEQLNPVGVRSLNYPRGDVK
tara:strand:- start:167 stop:883 length:717 start_codon:yes stop_codon:yes gene_type:complete